MTKALGMLAGFLALAICVQKALGKSQLSSRNNGMKSVKQTVAQRRIARFDPLANSIRVRIKVVPQKHQRYDTKGDWWWHGNILEIRLSAEVGKDDPRYR